MHTISSPAHWSIYFAAYPFFFGLWRTMWKKAVQVYWLSIYDSYTCFELQNISECFRRCELQNVLQGLFSFSFVCQAPFNKALQIWIFFFLGENKTFNFFKKKQDSSIDPSSWICFSSPNTQFQWTWFFFS